MRKVTELEGRIQQRSERAKHLKECMCHFDPLYLMEKESADHDGDPAVPLPTLNEPQWRRLLQQAATVASMYEKLCERDRLELVSARTGADAAGRADSEAMMLATRGMDEARRSSSIVDIARDVLKERPVGTTDTLLASYCECERLKGHFSVDSRGKLEKGWIFNEEDLLERFMSFLKAKEGVTVQVAHRFVNSILLSRDVSGVSMLDLHHNYGLQIPLPHNTVYWWMKQAGCVFSSSTQTFHADDHSMPEVVQYRDEVYIEKLWRMSLRLPLWVQVDVTALTDAQSSLLTDGNNEWELYEYHHGADKFVEFHVDRLGQTEAVDSEFFSAIREKLGDEGGSYSVRWQEDFTQHGCLVRHDPDVCKCHLRAYHVGQDEACFKAFVRDDDEWVIAEVRGLRKKSEGPGLMVSAFQDEIKGFGFRLSEAELSTVNANRVTSGKGPLSSSPGLRFLEFGENNDGYWTREMFFEQAMDLLDCLEVLYPDRQAVMEVDHSVGHATLRVGGLYTQSMNVKWGGGKGADMRSTVVTSECLGTAEAKVTWQGRVYDCKLKPGDTQHMCFKRGDPPPFYDFNAPPTDRPSGKTKNSKVGEIVGDILHGYVGKPKGKRQVLWERGLSVDGMKSSENVPAHLNINTILGGCTDFKNEKHELQHLVETRGHVLLISPKYHPEMAGLGIDYSWGKSKLEFRRKFNDCTAKNLRKNTLRALDADGVLFLDRVRRFARRTRDYRRVYAALSKPGAENALKAANGGKEGYELVEIMRKTRETHRIIVDIERAFVKTI